jgi:ribonuclease HI
MGIGWVQVDNNQVIQSFSAQILNWPTSYKAELLAILSAISTLPRNSTIDIFTDSQSVISKYNKLLALSPHSSKQFKFNAWPIWHTLLNILKAFNIQLSLYKVQAHSDNPFNNLADLLANNHSTSPTLLFNYTNLYNPFSIIQWNKSFIESPTRQFIKSIRKAQNIALWSSQHRAQEWSHFSHLIDWKASWLYFNNNQKVLHNFTNPKLNHLKSFKIKMLLNILPTHAYLHSIYPSIFISPNCFSCNHPDTPSHWYSCPDNTLLTQTINTSIHDIISNNNLNLPPYQLNNLIHTIISHPSFNPSPSQLYPYSRYSTLKGLIPVTLIQSLDPFEISYSQASQIIIKILLKISDQLYNNIWIPYCSNFSHWKRAREIPSRINNIPHTPLPPRNHRNRITYTYSCPCGFADQLHSDSNLCPPLGQASLKYNIWSTLWIKYNTSINHILTIQI